MNYVILNGEVLLENDAKLAVTNRAFRYGDALFETMLSSSNAIRFIDFHWDRLKSAMELLQMKYQQVIDKEIIAVGFEKLRLMNGVLAEARIRLQVFRNGEGLYTPKTNDIGYLLEVTSSNHPFQISLGSDNFFNVGFCDSIKLSYSAISSLKTCNSIPYVLAALERDQKGLDDLIIFNHDNFISECCSTNLFWWDGNSIFTPSLASGCISGVMRRVLLSHFNQQNSKVEEGLFPKVFLKSAKGIFTTNCTGIKVISQISDHLGVWKAYDNDAFTKSPVFASIQSLF